MSSMSKMLKDDSARRDAISLHDRSILVEAGAGSGKTAVMAGRIAAMLAEGVAPCSIAQSCQSLTIPALSFDRRSVLKPGYGAMYSCMALRLWSR